MTGLHFENCLNGSIYVGRSTPSSRKINIFASSFYANARTGALLNNNNDIDSNKENIVIVQDQKQVEPSPFGAMENTTFYSAKSILEQQTLPCVIEYQASQVYTFNPYLTIKMLIKGEAFVGISVHYSDYENAIDLFFDFDTGNILFEDWYDEYVEKFE
jgi:hypothetical protein